jgi:hypothetical protein
MATYKALSGETVFDVAAKLYSGDTALGLLDLLTNNPTINLDSDDLGGITLTYTASLKRLKPVFVSIPTIQTAAPYYTRERQSVYDLCIQLYGDLSKIGNLLELFPNLDTVIPAGSEVTVEDTDDPIKLFFSDRRLIVATDLSDPFSGLELILMEAGGSSYILEEDGTPIPLE